MFSSSYRRLFREKIKVICKILIKRKILQKGFGNHQYDEGGNKSLVFLFFFVLHLANIPGWFRSIADRENDSAEADS